MPKLSSYPAATNLTGATFPLLQAGVNKKATAALVGQYLPYTQPLTGAVERTLTSRLSDTISIKDFAGVGDDTTNNNTAYLAAAATDKAIYNPPGTYKTTLYKGNGTLPNRMYGDGVIDGVSFDFVTPQRPGRYFSYIDSAPSSVGVATSILTAFNGDWSRVPFPVEHWISGALTLTQPATGYHYANETYPHYTYLFNTSGWNQSTSGNDGRTAACAYRTQVFNSGQGDCMAYNASAFVTGARAGATNFLANPAASLFAGDIYAGQNGVYLNPFEILLDDQGFDVAGIGPVINLKRSVTTGALGAVWLGVRVQSIGAGAVDAMYSASGPAEIGLDLSSVTLDANLSAITLKANQRLFGNVTAATFGPSALGDDWFSYSTNINGWSFVVDGLSRFQITAGQVTIPSPNALVIGGNVGFYNTAAVAKQTLTGAKAGNAALTSVIAAGVAMGLWTDTTT